MKRINDIRVVLSAAKGIRPKGLSYVRNIVSCSAEALSHDVL